MEVYRYLCQFLIEGWRSLGISLHYGTAGRGYIHNPNCFGTATGADLVTTAGVKFIGSAQLRRGHAILQHGSMQLRPNPSVFEHVFGVPAEKWPALSPLSAPVEVIADTLTAAAQRCLPAQFIIQSLSLNEWKKMGTRHELPSLGHDTLEGDGRPLKEGADP